MALTDFNLPFEKTKNLIFNSLSEADGIISAVQILRMKPLPDAVFSANDSCAVSCMLKMIQEGIKIPADIAFAGFNNDPISRIIEPNLTTINYPAFEMGQVAARNLIQHLSGSSISNTNYNILLNSELLVRASSLKGKQKSVNEGIARAK